MLSADFCKHLLPADDFLLHYLIEMQARNKKYQQLALVFDLQKTNHFGSKPWILSPLFFSNFTLVTQKDR